MGKNYRKGRLSEEIRKCISSFLLNGIKDPRLAERIITISAIEVTSDGSYATVYVTPLTLQGEDTEEVCREVLTAFGSAKCILRKRVAAEIKLRHAPELLFKIDSSMEYGRHIDEILEDIRHEGEAHEQ